MYETAFVVVVKAEARSRNQGDIIKVYVGQHWKLERARKVVSRSCGVVARSAARQASDTRNGDIDLRKI